MLLEVAKYTKYTKQQWHRFGIVWVIQYNNCIFLKVSFSPSGTTYHELWKRNQEILRWEWDLEEDEDADEVRPDFETEVKTTR